MPEYKLTYFDFRGLGETTRMIFAQAGVPFTDERIAREDWQKRKSEMPFGQMPVLEIDGKERLAQSSAINRYLSRQFGLAGNSPIEEAKVDMLGDLFKDFANDIREFTLVAAGFKEGNKEQVIKDVLVPAVDKYCTFLEKFLKESGSGFLIGKTVTWVDFLYAEWNAKLLDMSEPTLFDKFPLVKAHIHHIHDLPNIKKYIATRPERKF